MTYSIKQIKKEWFQAFNDELSNMKILNGYIFVKEIPKKPPNLVSTKWVFRNKYNSK